MRKFAALVVALIALAIPSFAGNDALKTPAPSPSWAQVYPAPPNVGLLAARPTFCALTGQQYYATDNTTLYYATVAGTSCTWTSVGGSGVTATWGSLTAGANTNSGVFSMSQAGTFTLAAQNDNNLFTLVGDATCSTGNILNFGGTQTFKLTDGLAVCVNIPTSGVTNAFTNGMGVYMQNPNANTTGQFGFVGAVGYFTQIFCTGGSAANTKCWGANFGVSDNTSAPATLFGNEYDIQVNNTTTTGAGTIYSFRGAGQPTANNFPAVAVQAPQSTATFTAGFVCQNGSISNTNNLDCIDVGASAAGTSKNSQAIRIFAADTVGAINGAWSVNSGRYSFFGGMAVINYGNVNNSLFESGWGIAFTATATLSTHQLVKIDTAHADSVVVCTTADTSCDGFVAGTGNNCTTASTVCAIISTPGSLAKGIIGTGTCAIGNFVIVDTTTNGDVKCQAGIPALGNYVGKALSACAAACAGTSLDVLTKFE